MKRLHFIYHMKLLFSNEVKEHRFSLKCIPHDTDMQKIENIDVSVFPDNITGKDIDSHGNITIFGYTKELHDSFGFDVEGTASTGLKDFESAKELHMVGMYKYQTKITAPGESVLDFSKKHSLESCSSNEEKALLIMQNLNNEFEYRQGCTDMDTKAEEALKGGCGVCQDFAHIMLSLCRLESIPCRYVTGMMIGEGRSHAWVEAWDDNRWIGFDPTNGKVVNDEYIKISNGRDFRDCLVNQGIFTGNVTQSQTISVIVNEEQNLIHD